MAGQRHNPRHLPKSKKNALHELLDFGPEKETKQTPEDTTERIKRLVKQLEEINRRVDNLTNTRY